MRRCHRRWERRGIRSSSRHRRCRLQSPRRCRRPPLWRGGRLRLTSLTGRLQCTVLRVRRRRGLARGLPSLNSGKSLLRLRALRVQLPYTRAPLWSGQDQEEGVRLCCERVVGQVVLQRSSQMRSSPSIGARTSEVEESSPTASSPSFSSSNAAARAHRANSRRYRPAHQPGRPSPAAPAPIRDCVHPLKLVRNRDDACGGRP